MNEIDHLLVSLRFQATGAGTADIDECFAKTFLPVEEKADRPIAADASADLIGTGGPPLED